VSSLVFDSTALSHFAQARRLAELEEITASDECIAPSQVLDELARAVAAYPVLGAVSAMDWLHRVEIDEFDEVAAFARYKGELGGGPERNNGEAAVLAWVRVHGGIAIIDEAAARSIADRESIPLQGSLWLIIRGYRSSVLERPAAERLVDDLIGTGMWLPVISGAGLFAWAYQQGLLP
jgi:predicted nucleic acid-binding protein